ncbi:proline iminopeptidase [Xylogone sp. PMI_703]|nr:proline iminopeptidase [Xylogone sp. PMI_703]
MSQQFTEGEIDFHLPGGQTSKTYYRVYGKLTGTNKTPLIGLHGGPGAGHNYLRPLADLTEKYGIPVILYDQIGNGLSTHFPEKKGDVGFWTVDLFIAELDNLIDYLKIREGGFDILGQSWGGMLGAEYAIRQPKGLRKLVIANSLASMADWVKTAERLLSDLPQNLQDIIRRCEAEGDYDNPEYEEASAVYYQKHLCRLPEWPSDLIESLDWLTKKDPTVYLTMQGPSEFTVIGSLKDWNIVSELHKIKVPVLLLNGRYDEAQDEVVKPFFERIEKVKWYTFAEASHMSHMEERDSYMEIVYGFLC